MSKYVGIVDIGSGYLKGVVSPLEDSVFDELEETPQLTTTPLKKPSKGIERGTIIKVSQAKKVIREFLKLLADSENADIEELYLLLTHPKIKSQNINVELNLIEENPFAGEEEEEQLVQITEEHLQKLKELVRQQAAEAGYEIIHIIPRYFLLDGEKNYEPLGLHASKIEGFYHVIKLKKQVYLNVKNLVESLQYRVRKIMFPAYVSSFDILGEEDFKKNILIIDLGHTTVGFSYFLEGRPYLSGALDWGLQDIAEALSFSFKIPVKKVFEILRDVGYYRRNSYNSEGFDDTVEIELEDGGVSSIHKTEIALALRETISQLLVDVLKRLTAENVDIGGELDEIVLVGGGSNIKNIKELFEELIEEDLNCRIRIGKRKKITSYGEEEVEEEEFLNGDFAPVRGASILIRELYIRGLLEDPEMQFPFSLEKREDTSDYSEADLNLPIEEEEEKPKKGFFGKIIGFFKSIISGD